MYFPHQQQRNARRAALVLAAACVASVFGCGSGQRDVFHVSGRVMFDGQAVPAGFVAFTPDVSAGNDGTQGFAEIVDGQFDTSTSGKGITGGAYVLRVRGYIPPVGDTPGKMLFREYEQAVQLPAAAARQDVNVPASARAPSDALPEPT